MGTEVLRPQDLLVERFHVAPPTFHRRRNFPANENLTNLIVNRRSTYNAGHRKTSPKPDKKKSNESKKVTHGGEGRRKEEQRGGNGNGNGNGNVSSPVVLLRRGESLDSLTSKINGGRSPNPKSPPPADDLAVLKAPKSPELKQIRLSPPSRADVYAGSAFSLSPSPRSLPLPSFFNKKQQDDMKISPSENPATRDLRRLLRLD